MNERLKELAWQSGLVLDLDGEDWFSAIQQADVRNIDLERFAELIRADERSEVLTALDSDLEHGVKWLSEKACAEFKKNCPELNKLLDSWGNHETI